MASSLWNPDRMTQELDGSTLIRAAVRVGGDFGKVGTLSLVRYLTCTVGL